MSSDAISHDMLSNFSKIWLKNIYEAVRHNAHGNAIATSLKITLPV